MTASPRAGRFEGAASLLATMGAIALAAVALVTEHFRPWVSFQGEACVFVAFGLLVASAFAGQPRYVVHRAVFWPAVFTAGLLLQFAAGRLHFAGDLWVALGYLGLVAVVLHVGFDVAREGGARARLLPAVLWGLAIGAWLSCLVAVHQWLGVDSRLLPVNALPPGARPFANLNQPNHFGSYAVLGLVASGWLFEQRRIGRLGLALGAGLCVFGVVVSESRAAGLSLLLVCGWWTWRSARVGSRIRPSMVLGAAAAFVALWWAWPAINAALLLGPARGGALADSNGRSLMWLQLAHGLLQAPWTGFGFHQLPQAQLVGAPFAPSSDGRVMTEFAHLFPLDLMIWFGVPLGGLLALSLLVWMAVRLMRRPRAMDDAGAVCMLVVVSVHSLVEYPFAYSYFLLPAAFFAGMLLSPSGRVAAVRRVPAAVLLLALAGLLAAIAVEYVRIEAVHREQRFVQNGILGAKPPDTRGVILLLTQFQPLLEPITLTAHPDAQMLQRLAELRSRWPSAANASVYAQALARAGDEAAAARAWSQARALYGSRLPTIGASTAQP